MQRIMYLFKVSFSKSVKDLSRYKFNTFTELISYYMLFLAMFYGMKAFGTNMGVSPLNINNTLEGFIIGYFLWTIMCMTYSDTAYSIVNDAQRGTLEQLSMTGLGLHNVLIVRCITNLFMNLLISFAVLFIVMESTGYRLDIDYPSITVVVFLGIFTMIGIGLIFGGLALIFKQIKSILNLIQYLLIGLLMLNCDSSLIHFFLPFRYTSDMIFSIAKGKQSFLNMSLYDYGMIIGNSAVYLILGIVVFKLCENVAKKKGLLGQY